MIAKARVTLAPPRPGSLARPQLDAHLMTPVVVLAAGAGFGKSELLARWATLSTSTRTAYGLCSRLGETALSLLELLFTAVGEGPRFSANDPWQQRFVAGTAERDVDDRPCLIQAGPPGGRRDVG